MYRYLCHLYIYKLIFYTPFNFNAPIPNPKPIVDQTKPYILRPEGGRRVKNALF